MDRQGPRDITVPLAGIETLVATLVVTAMAGVVAGCMVLIHPHR